MQCQYFPPIGLLLLIGIVASSVASPPALAQGGLAPLAANNDDLFARDGGLSSWIKKRLSQRTAYSLNGSHPESFFKNAKIASGLFDSSGKIVEQWKPYFGFYANGTLGSGSTLKLPRSSNGGKQQPLPGDLVVIPRSERRAIVLVFLGTHRFPAEPNRQRDFFLYPYAGGIEINTFPPRYDWNYWKGKLAAKDGGPSNRPKRWQKDGLADLVSGAVIAPAYWWKNTTSRGAFRPSRAWKNKLAYYVVRTRQSGSPQKPEIEGFVQAHRRRLGRQSARTKQDITGIVLHVTGPPLSAAGWAQTWTTAPTGLPTCAHYVVGLDGEIYQCVKDDAIANQCAGANPNTIGIEHVGRAGDRLTAKQSEKTIALIRFLMYEYSVPIERVTGHRHTVDTDKMCPGYLFGGTGTRFSDGPHVHNFMGSPGRFPTTVSSWNDFTAWRTRHLSDVPNRN